MTKEGKVCITTEKLQAIRRVSTDALIAGQYWAINGEVLDEIIEIAKERDRLKKDARDRWDFGTMDELGNELDAKFGREGDLEDDEPFDVLIRRALAQLTAREDELAGLLRVRWSYDDLLDALEALDAIYSDSGHTAIYRHKPQPDGEWEYGCFRFDVAGQTEEDKGMQSDPEVTGAPTGSPPQH